MRMSLIASIASAALLAAACTQTGNMERGAATGAVLGGVAGAVIGNNVGDGDAETGAAIGAAVGAAGGAYAGCVRDGRCGNNGQQVNRRESYDARSGRYYFRDPQSGQYYYENGERYP
ncbi:YMGG-like glycine zipper-containing protein [Vitreimonas flagellata]|uniref:YMGG-like glycine zipper-containing protein n=1 Tax=Vitreimonas flagellata TaxID=2560861 RepID=UPI001074FC09|nr:YMGG-like glycine zipper-containing protein [Vitreimonas flagellata]